MIAQTAQPPYTAVIFTTTRSRDNHGYDEMAERMDALAAVQPGYLGIESVNDGSTGITVSYWESSEAARAWKQHAEHLAAQRIGRERWYDAYSVRVATVERDYRFDRSSTVAT
jgi:heme-degrading monooxygenase HmoA